MILADKMEAESRFFRKVKGESMSETEKRDGGKPLIERWNTKGDKLIVEDDPSEEGKDTTEKRAPRKPENRYRLVKSDDEKMLAFGWANVAVRTDGDQIIDLQGDVLDSDVLENAVYRFAELYHSGGEMHENGGVATLIESVVFTREKMWAMGIPEGIVPEGWWIGFHVTDPDVWEKIKSGEYNMFSIEGEAIRREIPVEQVSKTPSDSPVMY